MTSRADVVAAARAYVGAPWRHQGRSPVSGVDCVGLAICVARDLGLVAREWDYNGYPRQADGSMLRVAMRTMRQYDGPLVPGLVVLFRISRQPQHLGILGEWVHGGLSLIHSDGRVGRVVETRFVQAVNMRVAGVYDLPGVW